MKQQTVKLAAVMIMLASGWYYALVIFPAGIGRPLYADLYPSWYAARQVLIEHRHSPYSDDATREIQRAMYGRTVAGTAVDQQRFAYPLFAVFAVGPLALLNFDTAQTLAFGLFLVLSAAAVCLSAIAMGVRGSAAFCALWLASVPVTMGIVWRQPTLIYIFLLALAFYAAKSGQYVLAGAAAGLAGGKPQLAVAVLVPLLFWTLAGWKERRRFAISFSATVALLFLAATLMQPGWLPQWLHTLAEYTRYSNNVPLVFVSNPYAIAALGLAIVSVLWSARRNLEFSLALSTACFALIVPFQIYNQMLLLPAVLWIWREHTIVIARPLSRMAYRLSLVILACSMITLPLSCLRPALYQLPLMAFAVLGYLPLLVIAAYGLQQLLANRQFSVARSELQAQPGKLLGRS